MTFTSLTQAVTYKTATPDTGATIPICNGANAGRCTEADSVVVKKLRRAGKRAAPGDPDYDAQSSSDSNLIPDPTAREGE